MAADLALVLQVLEHAELVVAGDLRVDPVQLAQVDPLQPQAAQAQLALLAQVLRPADRRATRPGRCG